MKNLILVFAIFFCSLIGHSTNQSQEQFSIATQIQRVRVTFKSANGYTRYLLLAFTPNDTASDGFDYGYDALNIDNFADDMNWIIEDVPASPSRSKLSNPELCRTNQRN